MSAFKIDAAGYRLAHLPSGAWEVVNPAGVAYTVDPEAGTCNCPAGQRSRRRAYKHLRGLWALLKLVPALREEVVDRTR